LKYLLMILGVGLFGSAGSLVVYDIFISEQLRRLLARNKTSEAGATEAMAQNTVTFFENVTLSGYEIVVGSDKVETDTHACVTSSASRYPCEWLGTRHWKGGKIMSIPASTAALRPICQEIIPLPGMRTGPLG
jgi:hypothetical protein